MIKIKLSDLLGKNKMTQRIDIKQLNNICRAFNCEISDLLEYIPDKSNK